MITKPNILLILCITYIKSLHSVLILSEMNLTPELIEQLENLYEKPRTNIPKENILTAYKDLSSDKYRNKILIKRKVPHGIQSTGMQYDEELKTLYKPLIRIHKSKPWTHKNEHILKNIKKLTKKLKSHVNKLKAYDKMVDFIYNTLRSPQFEKSGEEHDPLAPGKVIVPMQSNLVSEKKKIWMPHYPPWNYWTYKKTIHQDMCPGNQVKLGNMCVWIPPH